MRKDSIKRFISAIMAAAMVSLPSCLTSFAEDEYGMDEYLLAATATGGTNPSNAIDGDLETVWTGATGSNLTLTFNGMSRVSRVEIDWVVDENDTEGNYKLYFTVNGSSFQEMLDRGSLYDDDRKPSYEYAEDGVTKTTSDTLIAPIYTQAIRIYLQSTTPSNSKPQIREVRIYGENTPDWENAAEYKTVMLTGGLETSSTGKANPNIINDGNFSTGVNLSSSGSGANLPFGAVIDLGEIYEVSDIYCRFYDMQKGWRNTYTYKITGSIDGMTPGFEISDTEKACDTRYHYFRSTATSNEYWSNGFYLTRADANHQYARYITIEVTSANDKYNYGFSEIAVMGKANKTESVLGNIYFAEQITSESGDIISNVQNETISAVNVTAQNYTSTDLVANAVVGIYRDGYLKEVIKSETPLYLYVGNEETVTIPVNAEITEGDAIGVWLEDAEGNGAPFTEKHYYDADITTSEVAVSGSYPIKIGYEEDIISVKAQADSVFAGRLAAIVMMDQNDEDYLAYEIVELDGDAKANANFKVDTESGSYTIKLLVQGAGAGYTTRQGVLDYTNTVYFEKAKNKLYAASDVAEIAEVLSDKFVVTNLSISIPIEIYNAVGTEKTNEYLLNFLKETPYDTFADSDEFINKLCEKLTEYSLSGAISSGNGVAVFEKYETELDSIFGINSIGAYTDYYKRYDKTQRQTICSRLAGKDLSDISTFADTITSEFLLGAIEAADSWVEVKNIMNNNTDFFGANNSKLSKVYDQSKVYTSMTKKSYSTAKEARDAESKLINSAMSSSSSSSSSSSGGGGGGSSSSTGVSGVVVYDPESSKTNTDSVESAVKGFIDMDNYTWAKVPAEVLQENGIVNGKDTNIFAPGDAVKREELVKMLCLLFDIDTENATATFTDISESDWSYKYVAAAQKYGLVMGRENNTFGLGENVSREEMAAICYRFALAYGVDLEEQSETEDIDRFVDEDDIADYAYDSVYGMKQAGILSGTDDGGFAPKDTLLRAEAAKIIYNLLIYINVGR